MRVLDNSTASTSTCTTSASPTTTTSGSRESFTKPYGMILVTGPTGSGKSTTLYATLNDRSASPRSTSSPSRTRSSTGCAGINQVQVNHKAGLTFAAALRSILRSDPDIVLIGEIRDHETAQIAVEAALTGHLVLSTLHTNDAPSAVTRLDRDGHRAVPRRLGAGLRARPAAGPPAVRLVQGGVRADRRGAGRARAGPCQDARAARRRCTGRSAAATCAKTGYRGRIALHEVMPVTEEIERLDRRARVGQRDPARSRSARAW